MIELVVISLFAILILAYYTLGRNISRPIMLYVLGFLFCSIVAYSYKVEWGLQRMSPTTTFVLIGGALMFYLVELYNYQKYKLETDSINCVIDDFKPIKPIKLILFLLFQLFAIFMMSRSEMSYAMTDELSEAMATVNQDVQFNQTSVSHPFYIQYPYGICMYARTLWCILLPYYLFLKPRYYQQIVLLALNLITGTAGTLLGGGRTSLLYDIISLIICSYICYQFKNQWVGGLFPRKIMLLLVSVGIIFSIFFAELGYAIGRKEDEDITVSILFSMYCGAEIKNLDDYIQHPYKQDNERGWPAQYTLCGMYDEFQHRIEGVKGTRLNQPDLSFNSYGNYPLGNVYSTYYNFIIDFGVLGAVLFTGFMSWFCSLLYRKTITSPFWRTGCPNLWMLYWAYKVPGACFLSFFANKFFENIGIANTIKQLFFWWVIIVFLYGLPIGTKFETETDKNVAPEK